MECGISLHFYLTIRNVVNRPSANADLRIRRKMKKTALEIVRFQNQIRIQFHDVLPIRMVNLSGPIFESFNDAGAWVTEPAVLPVESRYPGISLCVAIDDCARSIC